MDTQNTVSFGVAQIYLFCPPDAPKDDLTASVYHINLTIWSFLIVGSGTLAYYSYKRTPSSILDVGCYLLGVQILLKPIILFGSRTAVPQDS